LEKWKWLTKENAFILLFGGILLLVIVWPGEKKESARQVETIREEERMSYGEDYKQEVERELAAILSEVEGAGEVRVMIMLEGSSEKMQKKEGGIWDTGEAVVTMVKNPKITGALILYAGDGTRQSEITVTITEAVMNLLGLSANEVKVAKMNKK